jgi:hypothetical protein
MVNCEPGKIAMGRRRMKCRWKRKKGFFWRRLPEACQGCDPEDPTSLISDQNITATCTQTEKGFTSCFMSCSNGGKIDGGKKLKLKCKCPNRFSTDPTACSSSIRTSWTLAFKFKFFTT